MKPEKTSEGAGKRWNREEEKEEHRGSTITKEKIRQENWEFKMSTPLRESRQGQCGKWHEVTLQTFTSA
jgi:hypothetical protein